MRVVLLISLVACHAAATPGNRTGTIAISNVAPATVTAGSLVEVQWQSTIAGAYVVSLDPDVVITRSRVEANTPMTSTVSSTVGGTINGKIIVVTSAGAPISAAFSFNVTGGSGGTSGGSSGVGPPSVTVTPSAITLVAGQFYGGLSAIVNDESPSTVTWSIDEGAGGGSVDPSSGAYFAPATAGTYHVRATSNADTSVFGEAALSVAGAQPAQLAGGFGGIQYSVGMPSQNHLLYVAGTGQWWFFYLNVGDKTAINAVFSSDFVTWTAPAQPFDLSSTSFSSWGKYYHANQGENFALATSTIGGTAVAHLVYSFLNASGTSWGTTDPVFGNPCDPDSTNDVGGVVEARMVFTSAAFTPTLLTGTPTVLQCNQATHTAMPYSDAPSISLFPGNDGVYIEVGTGYGGTDDFEGAGDSVPVHACGGEDAEIAESADVDDGAGFVPSGWTPDVAFCVGGTLTSRQLLWDGSQMWYFGPNGSYLFYDWRIAAESWGRESQDYGGETNTVSIPADNGVNSTDWMAVAAGNSVHVVLREASDLHYTHSIIDQGTHVASVGGTIPNNNPSDADAGMFLAASGNQVILFALSNVTSARPLVYTVWNGTSWTPWRTLVADTGAADHLAGHQTSDGHIGLVWESTTPTTAISGIMLP